MRFHAKGVVCIAAVLSGIAAVGLVARKPALADGKVFAPAHYDGSIEERSQEAIIIFSAGEEPGGAVEDLILKISVRGAKAAETLGWVVPFPAEPEVEREDAKVFKELFDYVEARQRRRREGQMKTAAPAEGAAKAEVPGVEVLSRKVVGSYDVAIVRENDAGGLKEWLAREGFQGLGPDAGDITEFYRKKGYVYACMKVTEAALEAGQEADLHPLRFTFKTGGRDGIYFPMKMTGMQADPFNVNLYVFYGKWINDSLNRFGYVHRGFHLKHRDWDSAECTPNAGKAWSAPQTDPYLRDRASSLKQTAALFQKLHPGEKYYLTNLQAFALDPRSVRQWSDDLWIFPHYSNKAFVPYDARAGGIASLAWPGMAEADPVEGGSDIGGPPEDEESVAGSANAVVIGAVALALIGALVCFGWIRWRAHRAAGS